jgi:hypothetical protein
MNRLKRVLGVILALFMMLTVLPEGMVCTVVNAETITKTFAFTADDLSAVTIAADKTPAANQIGYLADGYLSVTDKGTNKVLFRSGKSEPTKPTAIEWGKSSSGTSVDFTVYGTANVTASLASTSGKNTSSVQLVNGNGVVVTPDGVTAGTVSTVTGSNGTKFTYTKLPAGNYSFSTPTDDRGARILAFESVQTYDPSTVVKKPWAQVAAPAFGVVKQDGASIAVNSNMVFGDNGADSLTCIMKNSAGTVVDTQTVKKAGQFTFNPSASGTYTFSLAASRSGENDKTAAEKTIEFVLPLAAPSFSSATSMGGGKVALVWNAVKEADSYDVSYSADGSTFSSPVDVKDTEYTVSGLKIGTEYTFRLAAKRSATASVSEAADIKATPTADEKKVWSFTAYGSSVSKDSQYNGYSGNANDGSVSVWSLGGKGKLVPLSTDGVSFYYTAIPAAKNFTLSADVTVDSWKLSNGQEGFGLMACDRVGANGSGEAFWNNAYMDAVTKVEYYAADGAVTDDTTANKITMKLGVGSQAKTGVTKDNLDDMLVNPVAAGFKSEMTTLDTSCAANAGTYNIVGNSETAVAGTVEKPLTVFHMTIQKNNTGYFVSYTDAAGNTTTKKYYDTEALSKIDADNVYAGIFASRNAKVTASNIKLTTIDPKDDAPAEEQKITEVTPSYQIISADTSNAVSYNLQYLANADGKVVIKDQTGKVLADTAVKAAEILNVPAELSAGDNKFTVIMTPNADYVPGEHQKLSSYDSVTFEKTVHYEALKQAYVYVGPQGKASNAGTRENPLDIYTAVKYVQPGQKIVLLSGSYALNRTVTVPRGTDGTADWNIYMIADPNASERPVLNFGGNCEGLVIAGNYWYFSGFDVTGSQNGKDGIRLSGSYDTVDNVNAYKNGNTGLQISRYTGTDNFAEWPHDNLILNCTSHENADAGYEDADGFAAKLTVGNNNVFDGCISYNNADDGWDLFAKVETGSIGAVTIQNCVAFANGYGADGTDEGNGNGFKMGGSSLSGKHVLKNCVSFDNKAKGIDSNSCPDIQVYNCTSYNNGNSNVAFYTVDAKNTDFSADGVISYRTVGLDVNDNIKPKGTQDLDKIYKDTNYYWLTQASASAAPAAVKQRVAAVKAQVNSVEDDWFVSLDTHMNYDTHVYSSLPITRNGDNKINMEGLLVLSKKGLKATGQSEAGTAKSGASLNTVDGEAAGTASKKFTVPTDDSREVITPVTNDKTGNADTKSVPNTGDATNTSGSLNILISALLCAMLAYIGILKEKHA